MKLLTLSKKLGFSTEWEYFDYCLDSYLNGNFSQCLKLFKQMTKTDKKRLINYLKETYTYVHGVECREFYINLL
jgi:hypothetical protein